MATNKNTENTAPAVENTAPAVEEVKDTRVKVYIDRRTGNDEPNLVVGINGKNYVLPRGQESLVPPEVAAEIERAKKAQLALDKTIDKLTAQAN